MIDFKLFKSMSNADERRISATILKVVGWLFAAAAIVAVDVMVDAPALAHILGTFVAAFAAYLVTTQEVPLDEFGTKLAAGAAAICALLVKSPLGKTDTTWPSPGQWFDLSAAFGLLAMWLGVTARVFEVWRREDT
jgi:hypothetical protein